MDREHGKDQRIEGEMTLESVDALLQELTRVREEVLAKQQFLNETSEFEKQMGDWKKARAEFARRQVAEWEWAKEIKNEFKTSGAEQNIGPSKKHCVAGYSIVSDNISLK